MEKAITRIKQKYYELGERAHKVLSWQLKAEHISRTINAIKTDTNMTSYKPQEINAAFRQFYSKLYQSESQDVNKIEEFLTQIRLPRFDLDEQVELNALFTQEEVREALSSLQSNKSLGENGFVPEFYK